MTIKEKLSGTNADRIPDIAFRVMSFLFFFRPLFLSSAKKLKKFAIKPGNTVIDYGCGPGNYIKDASVLVGGKGIVYAADIHELAIKSIAGKIAKYNLKNVKPVLIKDYRCNLKDNTADLIYALDMFHMVSMPDVFLTELHRMLKQDGRLIIEDGHQPRIQSKQKVINSKLWKIEAENRGWLVCIPVQGPAGKA